MRDALEDRRYVESYVETLTHEMKSPVAAIRGAAELHRGTITLANRTDTPGTRATLRLPLCGSGRSRTG